MISKIHMPVDVLPVSAKNCFYMNDFVEKSETSCCNLKSVHTKRENTRLFKRFFNNSDING